MDGTKQAGLNGETAGLVFEKALAAEQGSVASDVVRNGKEQLGLVHRLILVEVTIRKVFQNARIVGAAGLGVSDRPEARRILPLLDHFHGLDMVRELLVGIEKRRGGGDLKSA